jgi:Fe2+ transport system protein B
MKIHIKNFLTVILMVVFTYNNALQKVYAKQNEYHNKNEIFVEQNKFYTKQKVLNKDDDAHDDVARDDVARREYIIRELNKILKIIKTIRFYALIFFLALIPLIFVIKFNK